MTGNPAWAVTLWWRARYPPPPGQYVVECPFLRFGERCAECDRTAAQLKREMESLGWVAP